MVYQIINNIVPFIPEKERYELFDILDKLLEGNYQDKAKALDIKQSAYYQYKDKKLKISDSRTMQMLQLLLNKDYLKFNNFFVPIINQVNNQISFLEDCLNSGLLEVDFNLLFDTQQKYCDLMKDFEKKQEELRKQKKEELSTQKKALRKPKVSKLADLYAQLMVELSNPDSIGEVFLDCGKKEWHRNYTFFKRIASEVNFPGIKELTRAKIPSCNWFEHLFLCLREADFLSKNEEVQKIKYLQEMTKFDNQDDIKEDLDYDRESERIKEKLRIDFNNEGYDLTPEEFEIIMSCRDSLDISAPLLNPDIKMETSPKKNRKDMFEVVDLLKRKSKKPSWDNLGLCI